MTPFHRAIPPCTAPMRRLALACALLALGIGPAGAQSPGAAAATITYASADASIVDAQGQRRPAASGLVLASGDTIESGRGRVQLRMVDGAMMALQPDTVLRLEDYHLATAAGNDEKGFMSLVRGGLRTVSGTIGKARPDQYQMKTQVGLIGIRGTEYKAVLDQGLTVGVIGGRVAVCNDSGCNDIARGQQAFVATRDAKPVLSRLVSTTVPANTPAGTATADAATSAAPDGLLASVALPAGRTSGEQVRGYLSSLLAPGRDDQPAPGSFSPPPEAAAPADPGTPGSPPVAGPVPPEQPQPPTAPSVANRLPSSSGEVTTVSHEIGRSLHAENQAGYRTFEDGALVELRDSSEDSGKKLLRRGVPADARADGVVAWGRWTGGQAEGERGSGEVRALHYFTFAGAGSVPVRESYASFASTAPTVTSPQGAVLTTGIENTAGGSLRVAFPGAAGGVATYSLTVPVASQTFSLNGVATQTGTNGFAGRAAITSTGSGCQSTCTGALGGGNAVQGLVGGAGNSRAGLVYGFNSSLGVVAGAMVMKP